MRGAADRIAAEVTSWEGVASAPHRFGGTEFAVGRRELGHTHGDAIVDLPFPRRVGDQLIAAGRVEPHHWVPDSGWVTKRLRTDADVDDAIALLRDGYERAMAKRRPPTPAAGAADSA